MNDDTPMPEVNPNSNDHAVSVYGQADALDDFPVLKAFQQYVDAEQSKARKRMFLLCTFFICILITVIGVFLAMLMNVSARNQTLNDRMIELVLREREKPTSCNTSPVVVQPPQDSAAILAMTAKLEQLQKKLADDQAKAEKAAAEAAERARKEAIEAAMPKPPSAAELEVVRLKTLLAAEKERAAAEKEKARQAELEAYRRKYYPEYYAPPKPARQRPVAIKPPTIKQDVYDEDDADDIDEENAINYFGDEDDEEASDNTPSHKSSELKNPVKKDENKSADEFVIPVNVSGVKSRWLIPTE